MYACQVPPTYPFHTPSANDIHHTPRRAPEFVHDVPGEAHTRLSRAPTPAGYVLVYHQSPRQYPPIVRHHFTPTSGQPGGHSHVHGGHITGARVIPPVRTEFPSTFKPRTDPNMSHKEKVSNWIAKLPIYPINATATATSSAVLSQGDWHNECYPGVVSSASSVSQLEAQKDQALHETTEDDNYNYIWSTHEYSYDVEDSLSRDPTIKKTRGMNPFHLVFGKDQLFVELDDEKEYQRHRVTRYVRRMYRMDNSEGVREGPTRNAVHSPYNRFSSPSGGDYNDFDDQEDDEDDDDFATSQDPYMNRLGFKSQEHIMLTLREYKSVREQAEGHPKQDKSSSMHHHRAIPLPLPLPVPSKKANRLSLGESTVVKVKNKSTPRKGAHDDGRVQGTGSAGDAFERLLVMGDLQQAQNVSSTASQAMKAHFDFHSPLQGHAQSPLLVSQSQVPVARSSHPEILSPQTTRVVCSPPIPGKRTTRSMKSRLGDRI